MSLSRRTILAGAAAAAVPAVVFGQMGGGQPGGMGGGGMGGPGGRMSPDANITTWMEIDGYKQINVSKPVLDKATDDAVKDFAKAEIDEHETLKKKLADKGFNPLIPVGDQSGQQADGEQRPRGGFALQMKNEIAVQCVKSTNEEMSKLNGMLYDHQYTVSQLDAHMGLKDTVTVAMAHATDEMKPILTEAMTIIDKHIATLKDLHTKQLAKMKSA